MRKYLHDSDIWTKQRWFRKLHPYDKLAFLYIKDNCDYSGVWRINVLDLMDHIGIENYDFMGFIERVNIDFDPTTGNPLKRSRLLVIEEKKVWITAFIQFQQESKKKEVNPFGHAAISAFRTLDSHKLLRIAIEKGYITLIEDLTEFSQNVIRGNDKDKDILELLENLRLTWDSKGVQGGKKGGTRKKNGVASDTTVIDPESLCSRMGNLFAEVNPSYQINPAEDYPHLLSIAHRIEVLKKWQTDAALNGKSDELLESWGIIVRFCKADNFLATRTIKDIDDDNQWKRLNLTMQKNKRSKDNTGGFQAVGKENIPYEEMK